MTASSVSVPAPRSARWVTAASRTPVDVPRHPAWTAATIRRARERSSTGTQSAVTTPTRNPASAVARPSAWGGSACWTQAATIRVPCTCRAVTIGSGAPAAATAVGQATVAHSALSRKPCLKSAMSVHGACVSMPALAVVQALRYVSARGAWLDAGGRPARCRAGARPACAPDLRPAFRLAPPGTGGAAAGLARRDRRRSQCHALERDGAVTQDLVERRPLVFVLVVDAPDARVDEHLQAVDARRVREVDVGVANAGAVLRRLRDGVDLGVDGPEAVLLEITRRGP